MPLCLFCVTRLMSNVTSARTCWDLVCQCDQGGGLKCWGTRLARLLPHAVKPPIDDQGKRI